jgi:tetratricopeptide (TPR) repeat protein
MRFARRLRALPLFFLLAGGSYAAQPWDIPFGGDPQAMLEAASSIRASEDAEVEILLEDYHFSIDKSGNLKATFRRVFKALTADAAEEWADLEQAYDPWHEQRPAMRARIITADGGVHWLDPKTIADAPAVQLDSTVFSDRRVVRAPLPSLASGAIVETEITEQETPALSHGGVSRRVTVNRYVAIGRLHVRIEAAKNIALHTVFRQIPDSALKRNETKENTVIECDLGPFPRKKDFESNLPPDVSVDPWLGFSTGASWQALAAEYSATVEKQIQGADVQPLLGGVDPQAPTSDRIARIATNLHHAVRYTGVEFSDAAIIPAAPAEVLKRGYGDCKDKSSLMVAALRAAGMRANVALLASGYQADLETDLPGLDIMNHAIVRVDADPPLWIDATASDARIGSLPSQDQGRMALVASVSTTALVRTPEQSDAWQCHKLEVRFSDFGAANITETISANGSAEALLRAQYGGDEQKAKTALENYAKRGFGAKSLGKFSRTGTDNLGAPFVVTLEVIQSPQATTTTEAALMNVSPALVMQVLPFGVVKIPGVDEKDRKPREHDFQFPQIERIEYHFHVIPPTLFRVAKLPTPASVRLAALELTEAVTEGKDGSIDVDFTLAVLRRRITAAEFEAARDALGKLMDKGLEPVTFVPVTAEHLALGEMSKAIRMLRDHVEKHASDATVHIRFSNALLAAGLGDAARSEARKATEIDPKSAPAWQTLSWALRSDSFGRAFQGNWSQTEAEKALRKAMELDPENPTYRGGLAEVLAYDQHGVLFGSGVRIKEVISLAREVLAKWEYPPARTSLALALIRDNQLDAAREEAGKCTGEQRLAIEAVITTLKEGPGRAAVNLQSETVDNTARARVLALTGVTMLRFRRYEEARTLLAAAEHLMPSLGPMADRLKDLKTREDAMLPTSDPRYPVQRSLIAELTGNGRVEELSSLFVPGTDVSRWMRLSKEGQAAVWLARKSYGPDGISDDVLADMEISQTQPDKEGDDERGYRVFAKSGGMLSFRPIYVVKQDGAYKIIGSTEQTGAIGRLILHLVDQKQIEKAQWWLDKLIPELASDEVAMGLPAAKGLWSGLKPELRGAPVIRVAAASIIVRSTPDKAAMKILQDEELKPLKPLDRAQLDYALCEGFRRAGDWKGLLAASRRLMAGHFFANEGFRYFTLAATQLKSWNELKLAAQARVDGSKWHTDGLKVLIIAKWRLGETASALDLAKKLAAESSAGSQEKNLAMWVRILDGSTDAVMLADRPDQDRDSLYTVAMLQTQLKKVDDAQQSLKRAIETQSFDELDARAWVVYGKICDFYGFADEAKVAWERAQSSVNDNDVAGWSLMALSSKD